MPPSASPLTIVPGLSTTEPLPEAVKTEIVAAELEKHEEKPAPKEMRRKAAEKKAPSPTEPASEPDPLKQLWTEAKKAKKAKRHPKNTPTEPKAGAPEPPKDKLAEKPAGPTNAQLSKVTRAFAKAEKPLDDKAIRAYAEELLAAGINPSKCRSTKISKVLKNELTIKDLE